MDFRQKELILHDNNFFVQHTVFSLQMSWRRIGIIVVVLLAVGLLWFTFRLKSNSSETVCQDIVIQIYGNDDYKFVSPNDILYTLNINGLYPKGKHIKAVKLDKIRQMVEKMTYVKQVKCYFTKSNRLHIEVTQRQPMFRVINTESYFVDTERVMVSDAIPFSGYLPVASGAITKSFAQSELFDLVTYIESNKFLSNLIQQIYVPVDQEIELVPSVGGFTIKLGKIAKKNGEYDFEKKLKRLEALYESGALDRLGWNVYSTLDLRFDKQIVGKKANVYSAVN